MLNSSLRTRLITVLALTLLPAVILAIVESVRTYRTATLLADQSLVSEALTSVERERSAFIEARRTVQTIARLPGLVDGDTAVCRQALAGISAATDIYARLAVIAADGTPVCAVPDFADQTSFASSAILDEMNRQPRFKVTKQAPDRATGVPVVAVVAPVYDARGSHAGLIMATLRVALFERLLNSQSAGATNYIALVNSDGGLIAESDLSGNGDNFLPPDESIRSHLGADINFFEVLSPTGGAYRYALAPFVDDEIYLLIGATKNRLHLAMTLGLFIAIMAPLAMYALALSVAWYAVDRLVVRHIGHLGQVVERVERGEDRVRADLASGAPHEIEALATNINEMLDALDQREAQLELALSEQNLLTREVYHRVKNNLQIVSSLMNLQLRGVESEPAKAALLAAQKRIQAMSTVHEQLYRAENIAQIRLDTVLSDLAKTIRGRHGDVADSTPMVLDAAPITTDPDRAIPLALLITEVLANAFENSRTLGQDGVVQITLAKCTPSTVKLTIANRLPTDRDDDVRIGLGKQLIAVLARQLGGTVKIVQDDMYRFNLTFPSVAPAI